MTNPTNLLEKYLRTKARDFSLPIRIQFWNGRSIDVSRDPKLTLQVTSPLAFRYLMRPSLASLGEAYVKGLINFEGPVAGVINVGREISRLNGEGDGRQVKKRWRLPPLHTRPTDSKAVRRHYDVSDDFYRLWLDDRMVYSCAYFKYGDEEIHAAQANKLDLISRKLVLKPGDRFLDIGCGWGGLICWAAENYGVEATGITLSQNQYEYTRALIEAAGLQKKCSVLLCDYRDLEQIAGFDKIASVGMFEHVGQKNLPEYFRTANRLLRPGGLFLNHGIVSPDTCDGVGYGGGDFIDRYVFPDSELPKLTAVMQVCGREGFELLDVESLRGHYAQTLLHWVNRLESRREEAETLVGLERFRIWLIYMAACSIAFERGKVSVYQLLLHKDTAEIPKIPWARDHLYDCSLDYNFQYLRNPGAPRTTSTG